VIGGYFIPKGTLINPNIGYVFAHEIVIVVLQLFRRFMLNDPKIWGDPEVFRPERHLDAQDPTVTSNPNPSVLAFGFGMRYVCCALLVNLSHRHNRICPGRDIADRVGFYISATLMATYDILPFEGKSPPDPNTVEYTTDIIR
jgi:cytochrome P450